MDVLRAINPGRPHPLGTEANGLTKTAIERRFRTLGYETTTQTRFACNASASCGTVNNIIARRPGASLSGAVLLVAHYDSVAAGPGGSDDSAGVAAILEVARAIANERFRNEVAFLIDDGEEAGLLGAEAFVADAAGREQVGIVVNVEARGTFGPSAMFETSRGNRWLIRHLAGALDTPQTSSLFYTVYDQLPNDTDVTVFKRAGIAAVNYGAIRGAYWYHTPLDDVAHVSLRTLQHQGDNLLATARAFADADLDARSGSDATWFDVLGFTIVWWPEEWTLWIAIASIVGLVIGARRTDPRAMTFGVLATFVTFLITIPAAAALARLARLRSGDINFVADPRPTVIAMWLTGIACALAAFALLNRRNDPKAMIFGAAIVWHAIAIALALTLSGAAFLFVVPAAVVTICALAKADEVWTVGAGSAAAAIVMFPLGVVLYDALGGRLMIAVAIVIAAFATFLAPLFARWRHAAVTAVAAVVFAVVAMLQPAFTAERPRHISIAWVDDPATGIPQWTTRTLTERMQRAAAFERAAASAVPWPRAEWAAPAPRVDLPRVTLDAQRTANGARVRVVSSRGANRLTLLVQGGSVRSVNGVVPPPRPARFRTRVPAPWNIAVAHGVTEMVVDVAGTGRLELFASDTSYGLPAAGAALARARNASSATPVHDGDLTVTRARLSL